VGDGQRRGIGMTVDTVINYFLKAGASLRRSELWRETYEDAEGKSRVLRSGRFGVGVLAAYLLGDEISVATAMWPMIKALNSQQNSMLNLFS